MKDQQEREARSSFVILDLKDAELQDSEKEESKTFHKLHAFGINDNLWDRGHRSASETWKGECVELLVFLTRFRGTGTIFLIS